MKKEWIARITMVTLAGCCVFFAFDVVMDLVSSSEVDALSALHLVVETIATLSIIASLFLLRDYVRLSRSREQSLQASLDAMKHGLNVFIRTKVDALNLTPAEHEVAIMTMKGYTLAETAALRGTSEGTTKAQAHAVYQKANVASRAELILYCIEDAVEQSMVSDSGEQVDSKSA